MPHPPETRYLATLEPRDAASLPASAPDRSPLLVPLRPDRGGRPAGERWLRRLAETRTLWGHTCVSDHTLRRLERMDPLGLRLAARAGLSALVTMDVPVYSFMTPGQRARAEALHLHRLLGVVEKAPRHGLEAIPLVKALDANGIHDQLDLARELGVRRVAFYARELLLEGDGKVLRRFVRGAHRHRLEPILLGAAAKSATAWGPATLAARHHYVLARRGVWLGPRGQRVPLDAARWSQPSGRFILPGNVASLCDHNYAQTRLRVEAAHAPMGWGA